MGIPRQPRLKHRMRGVFSQALLLNRSPRLDDLDTAAFAALRAHPATNGHQGSMLYALQRVVAALGHCDPPVRTGSNHARDIEGADPAWAEWIERWYATSTLTPTVRAIIRTIMAKTGRWLAAEHPEITEPGQWTRATCAAWVAAVDRMSVGDWVQRRDALGERVGEPISPRTKAHNLVATRTFFRDCQEWEWIGRRFDPNRALALPRSVAALIGTNPRVIADEVWAKLLWAGLNLEPADLPGNYTYYPMELIRAVTLTWLFSGLRSDEIARLRVGCIRWQHAGLPIAGDSREVLAEDAVCLLDVPVHKTGTAFTKPVDPIVGQAIEAWQALRPSQPKRLDRKTKEHVHMLFSVRAQPVAKVYINHTIIPALCAKAGVPTADVRGNITSHRARSTIASQLYNAKEPMTLFELQAWLGHRTPNTTQHYAKITPNTLPRPTPKPDTSPATSAPSRSSSTATPSPPARPPPENPGSTTTSATASAPTASSNNARTGWPAPAAISTPRKARPRPNCWRPRTTCSACSPPSRSPMTNAPPSTTDTPPSPHCSTGSPTYPLPLDPPRVSSARLRP